MNKKEYKEIVDKFSFLLSQGEVGMASSEINELIQKLFKNKEYTIISDLYSVFALKIDRIESFEVAFSLNQCGLKSKSENIYESLLDYQPNNPAILNNLANIKKERGDISSAFKLIARAFEISPDDTIIKNNFNSINDIVIELKNKDSNFKASAEQLKKENNFVNDKLRAFISNVRKDSEYRNGRIAIPNWKFKVLMGTDEAKATSLKQQWIDKNYIRNTKDRDNHNVFFYELNPYLEAVLADISLNQINKKWIIGFENVTIDKLHAINYFEKLKRIKKVNKKYQNLIERDFDELVFNYLVGNSKAVIILSGSLLEILLVYYLDKKKVGKVEYTINNRTVSKDLYDAVLNDLLQHFESNGLISAQNFHLGNISRIYRNFIHPGKEVREQEKLDNQKSEISFMSVMELIDALI